MMRELAIVLVLLVSTSAIANEPSKQRKLELKNMLQHDCGSCHGLTLKGGLGPPLLASELIHKGDDFLVKTILEGRKDTAMPPWKPFLTKLEARWLVKILRH